MLIDLVTRGDLEKFRRTLLQDLAELLSGKTPEMKEFLLISG